MNNARRATTSTIATDRIVLDRKRHPRFRLLAAGLLAAGLACAPGSGLAQGRPAIVKVDAVRTEPMAQTMPVLGRVVARQGGAVAARVAGAVAEVLVEVGDRVEAGAVLARLVADRIRFERDLAAADAAVAAAEQESVEAELVLREQQRARLAKLRSSAAFSPARLADKVQEIVIAKSRIAAAAARLQMARARQSLRELDLVHTEIKAPYPGVVSRRHISPGAYLGVGDPIIDLIDDTRLEIEADVPTDRVVGLTSGRRVTLRLDDGSQHLAQVRAVVPQENPLTRTRAVRFVPSFGPMAKPLAIGQSVTLALPIAAPHQVVTVHKDAIIVRQGNNLVYVVDEAETAQIRPVRLGEAVGGRFEVKDGLKPGDVVVIRGNERLRPGQKVIRDGQTPGRADARTKDRS